VLEIHGTSLHSEDTFSKRQKHNKNNYKQFKTCIKKIITNGVRFDGKYALLKGPLL
jgi:hypothetical protein